MISCVKCWSGKKRTPANKTMALCIMAKPSIFYRLSISGAMSSLPTMGAAYTRRGWNESLGGFGARTARQQDAVPDPKA